MSSAATRRTIYEIRDAEDRLVARHIRDDELDGGKKVRWQLPDGTWGLNGTPLADLPLYGCQLLKDWPDERPVLLVEGEKAADAVNASGVIRCLGTVTGASATPGEEALSVLRGREVILWPDDDRAGLEHMERVARGVQGVAGTVRWYTWHDAPTVMVNGKHKAQDAADHPAVHEGASEKVKGMLLNDLLCAPDWQPEERNVKAPASEERHAPDWDDPAPLPEGLPPVAKFDPVLLPEPLRAWVLDIAERMQVPPDFVAAGAVIVAASLVGRKVGIHPKRRDDWLVVPNLWGAVVGLPAMLKSPALAEAMKPLERLAAEARAAHEDAQAGHESEAAVVEATKEALKHEIKKVAKDAVKPGGDRSELDSLIARQKDTQPPEEPTLRRYKTNDSTVEKLGELLTENPNGLMVYRDELSGWFRNLERQGREADRAFYVESWDGMGSFDVDRIGRGTLHVPALCVSILGGIQPGPLRSYVHEATRGGEGADGLLQRFQLLVWPDAPKTWRNVDRYPDGDAKNRAHAVYDRLDKLTPEEAGAGPQIDDDIPALRFSPDAQKVFDAWRDELETCLMDDELSPAFGSHLAKYRSLMPSLALVFHLVAVVDGTAEADAVSAEAARRAAAWCEYLRTHAKRLYASAESPAMEGAQALLGRIRKGDVKDRDTVRTVYQGRHWSHLSNADEVKAATAVLEDHGWLRVEKVETKGRPSPRLRLHPILRSGT